MSASRTTGKTCGYCGGTGKVVLHNSMFMADGFRRERCGVCAGDGRSEYQPAPVDARMQAAFRTVVAQWGGLIPSAEQVPSGLEMVNAAWRGARG